MNELQLFALALIWKPLCKKIWNQPNIITRAEELSAANDDVISCVSGARNDELGVVRLAMINTFRGTYMQELQ